jgi:CheY-like chemotaxis protein
MANVLLVDDDVDVADVFAEVLCAEGYSVRVAHNGREGLASLTAPLPDLVICDVEMPVLNGPDMAYQVFLRDLGAEKIPILLASGAADLQRIAERVGTPYYLAKPFTVEQLRPVLDRALTEKIPPRPQRTGS